MKYRKKPVVIEAFKVAKKDEHITEIPGWLLDGLLTGKLKPQDDGSVLIDTLEGQMRADQGDWIIRGVKGELYSCKPDIFAATYEPA